MRYDDTRAAAAAAGAWRAAVTRLRTGSRPRAAEHHRGLPAVSDSSIPTAPSRAGAGAHPAAAGGARLAGRDRGRYARCLRAVPAQHPDSQWAQEARIRIENFAQARRRGRGAANTAVAASDQPTHAPLKPAPAPRCRRRTWPPAAQAPQAWPRHGTSAHALRAARCLQQPGARARSQWKQLAARSRANWQR